VPAWQVQHPSVVRAGSRRCAPQSISPLVGRDGRLSCCSALQRAKEATVNLHDFGGGRYRQAAARAALAGAVQGEPAHAAQLFLFALSPRQPRSRHPTYFVCAALSLEHFMLRKIGARLSVIPGRHRQRFE